MKTFIKAIGIAVILLVFQLTVQGQSKEARDKIESARIALITERLELSPDQAEKFWPMYNEYTDKRRGLRQEYRTFKQQSASKELTEQESKVLLNKGEQFRERQLQLEKQYNNRMTSVITNRQMVQLRTAEDDFRRMLIERMEQRSGQQQRNQVDNQQRQQQRMNRQKNE
ncbi:MAG: hypothetical protein OCD76_12940 [Reichenbachiella sp.]